MFKDRRQLVAGTHGPYKFDVILFYRQRTDVRLLPLFRQRFYKDTDIQTSKGNITTVYIKTTYQHPFKVFCFFFSKKKRKSRPRVLLRHGLIKMQGIEVAFEVVEQVGLCRAAEELHTALVIEAIREDALQGG